MTNILILAVAIFVSNPQVRVTEKIDSTPPSLALAGLVGPILFVDKSGSMLT